jgi:hypothetical protein
VPRGRLRRVGGGEGEGRLFVLAVLGDMEVHSPMTFQAGFRRSRNSWTVARDSAYSTVKAAPIASQSAPSTSAVRYSAPGIIGAAEASAARPWTAFLRFLPVLGQSREARPRHGEASSRS